MRALTGLHAIEEYLKAQSSATSTNVGAKPVLVYAKSSKRIDELIALAKSGGISAVRADVGELNARVGADSHRGVLLEIPYVLPNVQDIRDFLEIDHPPNTAVLVLDGITDPHNLGAILRSADQFGVDLVVIPAHRSARLTDTVYRTSAGTAAHVPTISVPNITRVLTELKKAEFWIYGADIAGKSVLSMDISGRSVLVVGSEGQGISRLVRETCDELIKIPSFGSIDSLNASVATGVLLFELRRQQGYLSE
jgi:23S rRNA (guanosine2251-2'-O)-methyltransferase